MDAGRWERIQELYHSAREQPSSVRGEWLRRAAGPDSALLGEVRELLEEGTASAGPEPGARLPDLIGQLGARSTAPARYDRRSEVARGGQGEVLEVRDRELRRNLAMKVMRSGPALGDLAASQALARFVDEAQVTSQLDHPGIVPVHELGLDARGRVFFTMKLIRGESLASLFGKVRSGEHGWTRTRALGVLLKVCEAMAYAHHKGVVHRDLKPANVMVGRFGEVFVMDWGLARVLERDDPRDLRIRAAADARGGTATDADAHDPLVTMDGDVVGTPAYMSPEQALGELDRVGPQSDVYSAGAILYELLAGHAPYAQEGQRLEAHAVWCRVQKGPPPPLHTRVEGIPTELLAICERAMARAPEDRYPDMAALARDLSAFLEHRVVAAYETGAFAELKKWIQRNRALAAAAGFAVFFLVAGLGTALVLRQRAVFAAGLANESARVARERTADVLRLSAFQELERLQQELGELWPAHPARLAAFESWLVRAEALTAGLEPDPATGDAGHLARLASLRSKALPWGPEELAAWRERPTDRRAAGISV